jgi:myo-inositol-1(or 4)-monophosphatase
LAEESPTLAPDEHGVWGIPPGVVWLIDPLDGTTNYAHGLPVFCVSVGVALDGEPVAGAIYDPLRDELFSGARGLGAALNGAALPSLHPLPLDQALLGLDWSSDPRVRARSLAAAATILSVCHTGRALGSAALGHVYVAARRVHLYYHFHLQPWDVAAAAAILREVGGEIRRPEGGAWRLGEPALLSGHPALLDRLPPL